MFSECDYMQDNKNKIILDLCGGSGSWSKPYVDNGYDVRLVTLPDNDVITYTPPDNVYGILAAPPCTEFAGSGARWWKDKNPKLLDEALDVVAAIMAIIAICRPDFWCLENPIGRLVRYIGKPVMYFNPCDYGDPWTKKTCLWGKFNIPEKNPVEPVGKNPIHYMSPGPERAAKRSITPPGFAKAFYEANQ
jgi:hypothetical protein